MPFRIMRYSDFNPLQAFNLVNNYTDVFTDPNTAILSFKVRVEFDVLNRRKINFTRSIDKDGYMRARFNNIRTRVFDMTSTYDRYSDPRALPTDRDERRLVMLKHLERGMRKEKNNAIRESMQNMQKTLQLGSKQEIDKLLDRPSMASELRKELIEWKKDIQKTCRKQNIRVKMKYLTIQFVIKDLKQNKRYERTIDYDPSKALR